MLRMFCGRASQQPEQQQTDDNKSPAVNRYEPPPNGPEHSLTYAAFDKRHSPPANSGEEQCYYANVPASSDSSAVIYSEVRRRESNPRTVSPPDEQYANLPQ